MKTQTKKIGIAVVGGLLCFVLVVLISKGIFQLFPTDIVWLEQVLLKTLLILFSLAVIRFVLKLSWEEAGFRKPVSRMKGFQVFGTGAVLGAITTLLIFFTPAEGNPLVRSLNLLEFILIIGVWSSLAEEIFIRGWLQSYLQPFADKGIAIGKRHLSVPVIVCAAIFSAMHLGLLFADIDLLTVLITIVFTFLLGMLAGIFRERYQSNLPAFLTHVSFNMGAIGMGIILGIGYKLITGDFPTH